MSPETRQEIVAHDLSGPVLAESPVTTDAQTAPQAEENPGMDLLRAAGFTLNPSHLPNVRLDGENVALTISTTDNVHSNECKLAIAALRAQGCVVSVDTESQMSFSGIQISAPQNLFSPATIDALTTKATAERIASEQRDAARLTKVFDPGAVGVGC
jgi:hypothetical protein